MKLAECHGAKLSIIAYGIRFESPAASLLEKDIEGLSLEEMADLLTFVAVDKHNGYAIIKMSAPYVNSETAAYIASLGLPSSELAKSLLVEAVLADMAVTPNEALFDKPFSWYSSGYQALHIEQAEIDAYYAGSGAFKKYDRKTKRLAERTWASIYNSEDRFDD